MFADYKIGQEYLRDDPKDMENSLADVDAAKGVKAIGNLTKIFDTTHTLLHLIVGNDDQGFPYRFLFVDIASKYVGEQLWDLHYVDMINLFEIYGHRSCSKGGKTLKCRYLQDGSSSEFVFGTL